MTALVLSLVPGIGLLDRGFEDEGFCVVRGPDLLWGGDVKKFHPPGGGRFDGVIGGPPCKAFSPLANLVRAQGREPGENLIPEFEKARRLQGLPEDFDLPPFRVDAKCEAVGNGVPYPLARAVARAVREAMEGVRS